MTKLTIKQRQFVDAWLENGNATEAYLSAYSNKISRAGASANAQKLFARDDIKAYIAKRMETLESKSIAKQEEVLQYLTSIMRGERKEEVLIGTGRGNQKVTEMDVSAKDRIKAAELLGKRYGIFSDKLEIEAAGLVVITDDISRKDGG